MPLIGRDSAALSLEDVLERHVESLRWRNLRASTIEQRVRVLTRLARAADPWNLLELDGDQIRDLLGARQARPLHPASKRCYLAHLADFYRWCVQVGIRSDNAATSVERPRTPRRLPRPIADADLARALVLAPNLSIRATLMFAAYAGLRGCEIAAIAGDHLLMSQPEPVLLVAGAKGGDDQTVALAPCLLELAQQLPATGPVIPRGDGRPGHRTAGSLGHMANSYLHSIGIASTLHTLRHWFGTNLYVSSDGDLLATQKGLRHQWCSTTEGYVEISPAKVSAAIRRLPTPAALAQAA